MDGKSAQLSPVQQFYVAVGSPEVKLVRQMTSKISPVPVGCTLQTFALADNLGRPTAGPPGEWPLWMCSHLQVTFALAQRQRT